jgi:biotin carboxylase
MPQSKNIVLFIGPPFPEAIAAVKDLSKHMKKKYRMAFVMNKKTNLKHKKLEQQVDFLFKVDPKNLVAVEKALIPIKDQVIVVTCRSVFYMPLYAKIISLFPHLVMPTKDSIDWVGNKLYMRRKFRRYFPEITPKFTSVHGARKEDVDRVIKYVGFPCVVKPASLAASRLVAICYHEEELQSTLRKTFRGIKSAYKKTGAMVEPEVIVEQFMEGDMYSIDSYIDDLGDVKHLPIVQVKTGQNIGVDDFYNYRVLTPTKLNDSYEKSAQEIGDKAIKALGLRSCMVHMEFIKMDEGWRVLEIDARMGGHRDLMYRESFAIPHGMNDLLTRMGEKPVVKKKVKKYTASFNIFPKKKGVIKSIKGLKKVRELDSLKQLIIVKKVGDKAGLSKQGFNKVLDITLSSESRSGLLADIRRMEKALKIVI